MAEMRKPSTFLSLNPNQEIVRWENTIQKKLNMTGKNASVGLLEELIAAEPGRPRIIGIVLEKTR